MRRLSIAISLLLIYVPGCSLLFMPHLSQDRGADEFPDCTQDTMAPMVDVVTATLDAVQAAVVVLAEPNGADDNAKAASVLTAVVGAAVYGYSAHVGFERAQECREATARWTVDHAAVAARAEVVRAETEKLAAAAPTAAEPTAEGYCAASASDSDAVVCARSRAACDDAAKELAQTHPGVADCAAAPTITCYRTLALDGAKAEHCFPTLDACVAAHGQAAARADVYQRVSKCASPSATPR